MENQRSDSDIPKWTGFTILAGKKDSFKNWENASREI
jgi:hypothetical protein